MKAFRGTFVLVAIFGGLLAFLLIAKPKSKDEREEAAMTVVSSERDSIARIAVANTHGEFVLEKKGEAWHLTAPVAYPVEESVSSQMLNALSELVATDVVWKAPTAEDRAKAGLAPPAATVTWTAKDGEHTLQIGKPFAKGQSVYVAKDAHAPVFLTRAWSVEAFGKTLDELRRKKLFDLHRDDVRDLRVEMPGRAPLAMTRADTLAPWKVESPFRGRADRGKANGLLTKIQNLRAEAFVAAPDREHGLEKPRATITLGAGDGGSHLLRIGAEAAKTGDEAAWYAQIGTAGQVVLVKAPVLDSLAEPFEAWRDPALFDFDTESVQSLELTVGGRFVGVTRDLEKNWKTLEPQKDVLVNPEATSFLRQAKLAKAVRAGKPAPKGSAQEKAYGLHEPLLYGSWVSLQEKHEIAVGKAQPGTTARWVRTHESDVPVLVEEDLVKAAVELEEAARRPPPSPTPTSSPAESATASPSAGSGTTTIHVEK